MYVSQIVAKSGQPRSIDDVEIDFESVGVGRHRLEQVVTGALLPLQLCELGIGLDRDAVPAP